MRSSTMFSLALVAATVAPAVMSIPLAGRQLTQPTITAVQPALNQTAGDAHGGLIDGFLSTLSPEQLEALSGVVDAIGGAPQPTTSPTPTAVLTSSGAAGDLNQPEKRGKIVNFFKKVGQGIKGIL
ncbi:hypothetical protein V8E55_007229 [Tylopilus felleus]